MGVENANMETIARSLIQSLKYRLSLLINLIKTLISTCFILKQCGVPTMRIIIKGTNVFLRTTGRILGGNHSFTYTQKTSA